MKKAGVPPQKRGRRRRDGRRKKPRWGTERAAPKRRRTKKPWTLYCIYCELPAGPRSYVGVTVDLPNRLRQHNGEIKGGARYTTSLLTSGAVWRLLYTVSPFAEETHAKQWEYRLHSRKRYDRACAICNRFRGLKAAMKMPRVTKRAPDSSDLGLTVAIHVDTSEIATKTPHTCGTFPQKTAHARRYTILRHGNVIDQGSDTENEGTPSDGSEQEDKARSSD